MEKHVVEDEKLTVAEKTLTADQIKQVDSYESLAESVVMDLPKDDMIEAVSPDGYKEYEEEADASKKKRP